MNRLQSLNRTPEDKEDKRKISTAKVCMETEYNGNKLNLQPTESRLVLEQKACKYCNLK